MKHIGIIAAVVLALVVGTMLAADYGPSYDEGNTVPYGNAALGAYLHLAAPENWDGNLKYYGPFYLAASEAVTAVIGIVGAPWTPIESRHFAYFLSLPIAMLSLYALAIRWVARGPALVATLLFATQPLFFGHAFINPKDMPFLAFFALSMALGMWMTDKMSSRGFRLNSEKYGSSSSLRGLAGELISVILSVGRGRVALLLVALGAAVALTIEILLAQDFLLPGLVTLTRQAYSQTAHPVVNQLFASIAEQSSELTSDSYVVKTTNLYHMWGRTAAALAFVPALIISASILLPVFKKIRPAALLAALALAGSALGLATSIRLVGPLAGLLVTATAIIKTRKGALLPLILYWIVAVLAAYFSWPYLWGSPASRLWESYQVMSNFEWEFPVLFRGTLFAGNDLPSYFVPQIFSIQLTLPALLLGAAGFFLAIRRSLKDRSQRVETIVVAAWLFLPLAMAMLYLPAFYDNARQFLFILPPVFLFGSLGLGALWNAVSPALARTLAVAVILLPGIVALVRLHPYQYIYYNELVGGVAGAHRNYELDYLTTSLREALQVANEIASADAVVYVGGPWEYMWPAARPDLQIYDPSENAFDPEIPELLLLTTRANSDAQFRSTYVVIEEVGVLNIPLALVVQGPPTR